MRYAAHRLAPFVAVFCCSLWLAVGLAAPAGASRTTPQAGSALHVSAAPPNPAFVQSSMGSPFGAQSSADVGQALGDIPGPQDFSYTRGMQVAVTRVFGMPPATYDLRSLGRVTSVKNQNPYGTCWAFASCGSLESDLLPGETWDFSEDNMVLTSGFDTGGDPYDHGGQIWMSTAYLVRWGGPVNESEDGYGDGYTPAGLTPRKHVQEVKWIPARGGALDNDNIKNAVMQYGGAYVAMGWFGSSGGSAYYNATTRSYYYNGTAGTNHGVLIVGWDDNYAAANFATTPAGNGAFIVKNSWGTAWGNSGYFYVSYYDSEFGRVSPMAVFDQAESTSNYTGIYQYDPLGDVTSLGYGSTTGWMANAFTAQSTSSLSAVGFYALAPGTSYEVYTGSSLGTKTLSTSGSLAYMGYHTVTLPSPVDVTNGQPFVVAVKVTSPGYNWPMAVEYPVANYSSAATAQAGQSYISSNGTSWADVDHLERQCQRVPEGVREVRRHAGAHAHQLQSDLGPRGHHGDRHRQRLWRRHGGQVQRHRGDRLQRIKRCDAHRHRACRRHLGTDRRHHPGRHRHQRRELHGHGRARHHRALDHRHLRRPERQPAGLLDDQRGGPRRRRVRRVGRQRQRLVHRQAGGRRRHGLLQHQRHPQRAAGHQLLDPGGLPGHRRQWRLVAGRSEQRQLHGHGRRSPSPCPRSPAPTPPRTPACRSPGRPAPRSPSAPSSPCGPTAAAAGTSASWWPPTAPPPTTPASPSTCRRARPTRSGWATGPPPAVAPGRRSGRAAAASRSRRGLAITVPSITGTYAAPNASLPVSWTTSAAVPVGAEFAVWADSGSGWYIGKLVAADGTASYNTSVTLNVPPGTTYSIRVGYRATAGSGAWSPFGQSSGNFTVTAGLAITVPSITGTYAAPNASLPVSWTTSAAVPVGAEFAVWADSGTGWYIGKLVARRRHRLLQHQRHPQRAAGHDLLDLGGLPGHRGQRRLVGLRSEQRDFHGELN